jgi:hypothetical protein
MQDSDLQELSNTAHYYMECSNKGRCDRSTGECQCFDGYDGVACQRASCPGFPHSCSGHGVCKTISQLANSDYENIYKLWDRDSTMGCECDKGYSGPDCSERLCKFGVDPLYLDDATTAKYSIFDVAVLTTSSETDESKWFSNGETDNKEGHWALRFYDAHEEDWVTTPIVANAGCEEVVTALETLPNDVIPGGSIECTDTLFSGDETLFSYLNATFEDRGNDDVDERHKYRLFYRFALWEARTAVNVGELGPDAVLTDFRSSNETSGYNVRGHIYRLKFYGNPGKIREPSIVVHLDGARPSLVSPDAKVITRVWTDGQQGENKDYFADHCAGVTATVEQHETDGSFLNGLTTAERNLLKRCLGDSDLDKDNNVDVYNWDYGNKNYPHIIKLVRTVTSYRDGGYYAVLWFDDSVTWDESGDDGTFRLLNPFVAPDQIVTDTYDIYTTKGTLALTSNHSEATFGFASQYIYTVNATYDLLRDNVEYDGDLSCEKMEGDEYVPHCVQRSDIITMLNWEYPQSNPPYINLYTVKRVYTEEPQLNISSKFSQVPQYFANETLGYMRHMITTDISTNWGVSIGDASDPDGDVYGVPHYHVYKFTPAKESTYEYVAECSARGICDRGTGVCKCFAGYTSDSCSEQDSLSL